MRKYLFLASVSLVSSAAHAQEAAGEEREIVLADTIRPVITVTANGLSTSVENTGQTVTVLDRAEIENVQGADATRALQRIPGLSLSRSGGVGGFTAVSIRGANAEQLLVLVDGVRVADPAAPGGGFDFGNLLLGTASTIDMLRGSNSTIWGSDAIGGVVDVATRGESGVSGNLEYGSRDTLFASAAGGASGESYYAGLTGSWYRSDGFSTAASGSERDGFEQLALGGQVFVDVTHNLELFAHGNWSEGALDLDGFPPPTYAFTDTLETQDTRRHWGDLGFAWYGNDVTLRGAYSLADIERDNRDDTGALSFASDGHSERLSLRGEYRAIGPLTLAFGAEQEWTAYSASFSPDGEADIFGAYLQLGFVMGRIAAHVGARVDDHSLFGSKTSHGADFSYGFGTDWRVRASFGEGFKAPTLFQLLSDYGNTSLTPEQSTSIDLGIEKGRRGVGTHLALGAFRRDSEDLIGFVSCFGVTGGICTNRPFGTYANTARARAQGIEAEAGFDIVSGLRLSGVYSFVDAEDRTTSRDLARRPRHFATLFADYEAPFGLKLGADLRLVGASYDNGANTVRLGGYEVVDLRAAMPVSDHVEIYGRVENLFDADYASVAGYSSPGRGAFLGVRARM